MIHWAQVGLYICGLGSGWFCRDLLRGWRPIRARCAWCNRVHVSATGQACAACLKAVQDEGRAAPEDWPAA